MILARQAWAFLIRDLRIELSYRALLLQRVATGLATLLVLFFVGQTVGFTSVHLDPYGGDYFAFAVIGLATLGPMTAALGHMAMRVREAQLTGTLEAILAAPIAPWRAIVLSTTQPVLMSAVRMVALLAGAVLFFELHLHLHRIFAAIFIVAMTLIAYGALGLVSAAVTLRYQRGDPMAAALNMAGLLLGGVFFPIELLPDGIRNLSDLIPVTHALEALRGTLLLDQSLTDVGPSIAALAAFPILLGIPAAWIFKLALQSARKNGTLTHY